MGDVYRARDPRLNRIVAIKQTKPADADRFTQEARAIASLNHPHICQIYDVGRDYIVMEFVDGAPVKGPVPTDSALKIAREIAGAVEEAHAKHILHRDLKPANILVTASGSVKLLDFGLAKVTTPNDEDATTTSTGTVVGTAAYMSPEQAQARPLDERSDIFSFGVVLYELLSGRRAFPGASVAEVTSGVLRDDPPPLVGSGALGAIVSRCMRKRAADRFESMTALRHVLELVGTAGHDDTLEPPPPPDASIAVLPFASGSRDPDDEFLSDGLAEEIINLLARVPGLKVTARTSAFAFKGQNADIRKIADALGVRTILEGGVRRLGNHLRVTAQLINAADGYQLWSERFDRQMDDIFAVQDEIAGAITGALQTRLSIGSKPVVQRYQPDLQAYEAVLKAWHAMWLFTPDSMARSRECFELAIRLDPRYAQAYSGFAHHAFVQAVFFEDPKVAMPRARLLAEQAQAVDPAMAEPYALAGIVAAQYEYDYAKSERLFRQALSCDPVPPVVRMWYGFWLLRVIGPTDEGIDLMLGALQEDPLNHIMYHTCGGTLSVAGRLEEAEKILRKGAELPASFALYVELALVLVVRGKIDDALRAADTAFSRAPWSGYAIGTLAGVSALAGDHARSNETLRLLDEVPDKAFGLTVAHVLRGDLETAAQWASRMLDERLPWTGQLMYPFAAPLRASEWWPALREKLRLP
jgi:serine/threonine protein kinase/tetratricopeptide (TPR) repeat protein